MTNLSTSGTVTMTVSLLMPRIAALATSGIETLGRTDLYIETDRLDPSCVIIVGYCDIILPDAD